MTAKLIVDVDIDLRSIDFVFPIVSQLLLRAGGFFAAKRCDVRLAPS